MRSSLELEVVAALEDTSVMPELDQACVSDER
jgi:hypothetical protein